MIDSLKGKTVIVTGGSSGIGLGCAKLFAEAGLRVAILGRSEERLRLAAAELKPLTEVSHHVCDVASEGQVLKVMESIGKEWGGVDYLINNAGIVNPKPLAEMSLASWDEVMGINVRGPWLCAKAVLPWMKMKGGGAIVNIGSLAGIRGTSKFFGFGAYTVSKFAVVGLTEAMAVDFKQYGIRVNCVAPGAVNTPLLKSVAPHLTTQAVPADIAEAVLFFCDPVRSRLTTGSTLEIFSNS